MSEYEQRAVQAFSAHGATTATVLKGIGWTLLALTEALLTLAEAARSQPAGTGEEEQA